MKHFLNSNQEGLPMERSEMLKNHDILNRLSCLPQKILSLSGSENITEFVLHELCNSTCFNLQKAAYIVDNPDFDCLKGIAGFNINEEFPDAIWQNADAFSKHMSESFFNQKVRTILRSSPLRSGQSSQQTTDIISDCLGFDKPLYCSWRMKHDNHGYLVYETESNDTPSNDLVLNGACFLSFCPIY